MKLVPKDVEIYKKFKNGWSPTQKLNIEFSILGSQEIGSNFISFDMISEAPESELLRFDFETLSSNAQKTSRNSTYLYCEYATYYMWPHIIWTIYR